MIEPIRKVSQGATAPGASVERPNPQPGALGAASFQAALDAAQERVRVRFSAHAQRRLSAHDIQLDEDDLARLSQAVDRAQSKGGRESLILLDDLAFIVSVPNRLVVTAIGPERRKEGVFTHIDTVVLADR